MKRINELKAGSILSYVNLLIGCIIPLLYTPVMLDIMGQAEYGLYSLSNSVISYLGLLNFGMGSAVIRLTLHGKPPVEVADEKLLFKLIRASFAQRRKTLVNGLTNSPELSFSKEEVTKALETCGYSLTIRGEALTLSEFARLASAFSEM